MFKKFCCAVPAGVGCVLALTLLGGCGRTESYVPTRMHLSNESQSPVLFLAIEDSELAASTAENRLAQPLLPNVVFSAVLSRPGNYWVRTETQEGGSTVRRIVGPIRLGGGVFAWDLTREDEAPLYNSAVEVGSRIALAHCLH